MRLVVGEDTVWGRDMGDALCGRREKPPVRMEFQKRTWFTNPPPPLRTAGSHTVRRCARRYDVGRKEDGWLEGAERGASERWILIAMPSKV